MQFDTTSFQNSSYANLTIIPDTYRAAGISYINSVSASLNQ